jgi:hypothetical protein
MTTRKSLIITKYIILEENLKNYISDEIFPSLDNVDVADLVYLITMTFIGIDEETQMNKKIKELIASNNIVIEDAKIDEVVILVSEFVFWLKKL